jgi:hypothetical protein
MRVGVIGSGLAGLSAACTLAARGHEVEVFEKNEWLGGKAAQLREKGFRFDMGPTILIQPMVLRKIFEEAGKKLEDYMPMVRLDPQWRCFFDDGATIDLLDDEAAMSQDFEGRFPGMGGKYKELMALSRELHTISDKFFFWKSVGSIKDTLDVGGVFDIKVLRCAEDADGKDCGRDDSRVYCRSECGADAGSHGAVCGVESGCFAGDFDCNWKHADGRGHLVPDGWNASGAGGDGEAGDGAWCEVPYEHRRGKDSDVGKRIRVSHRACDDDGRCAQVRRDCEQ